MFCRPASSGISAAKGAAERWRTVSATAPTTGLARPPRWSASDSETRQRRSGVCSSPPCAEAHTGGGAFAQDLAAEAEQFGRTPAGRAREFAGALHQSLIFDQAAEVLLVQANAGDGFHGALQFQHRE